MDAGGTPTGASATVRRLAAVLGAAAGLAVSSASLAVPARPREGGGRDLDGWLLAQVGVCLVAASRAVVSRAPRPWLLGALLVAGTAAQLRLTSPHWLQFIDLRPRSIATPGGAAAAAILALQAGVVIHGLRGRIGAALAAMRGAVTPRSAAVVCAAFLLSAAHASPFVSAQGPVGAWRFALLLTATAVLLAVHAGNAVLFAAAVPPDVLAAARSRVGSVFSLPGRSAPPARLDRAAPWIAAAWTLCATVVLAVVVFERVPHVPDEAAYLFQARCIANGTISAPAPAVPEAFSDYLIDQRDGRWFSTTNPGWPAVLAVGVAAGVPWLVNPILAAATVLLGHRLLRRFADTGTAHAATCLVATSPWFLFLGASMMTQTVTLVLVLGAWNLLARRDGAPGALAAAAAGLLLGALVVVRPLDGVIAGVVTGLFALATLGVRPGVLLPYAAGCVAGAVPYFAFNAALTGSAFLDPMARYLDVLWYPGANRLGFGADVGNVPTRWGGLDPLPGHGLADVLVNANQNFYNLNFELWGWAAGSLALVVVRVAAGGLSRIDRWMCGFAAAPVVAYSLYWFSGGPDFGARYWYLALVPCAWLTVGGALRTAAALERRLGAAHARSRTAAALALLAAASVTTFLPWRAVGRYVEYRGFHADYARLAASGELDGALVLVRTDRVADAASALACNPPTLDPAGPLFARDLGPDVESRLRAAFPDRRVVHVQGRTAAGGGIRIAESSR